MLHSIRNNILNEKINDKFNEQLIPSELSDALNNLVSKISSLKEEHEILIGIIYIFYI